MLVENVRSTSQENSSVFIEKSTCTGPLEQLQTVGMNTLESYALRELPAINEFIFEKIEELDELVRPVAHHVMQAGGKRLRPMLTLLIARALGQEGASVFPLASSLEFLHSATLLHDDILDDADLRRGQAAAHTVFTKTQTILAGDVLLALANQLVANYGIPKLVSIFSRAIMLTVTGEIKEIDACKNQAPDFDQYMDIITGKTAYLIEAACQAAAVLAGADEARERAAADYGLNLGIAFQLVDDALDYTSPSDVSGKPAGGDLREGKVTLPLLHYLEPLPDSERALFLDRLKKSDFSEDEISTILKEIVERDIPERTREFAVEYMDRASAALEEFPDSPEKATLIQAMEFVLTRTK